MDTFELARITYIASCGNYVIKHYADGTSRRIQRMTLKEVEERYCVMSMIRIHKQYIINLRHLADYNHASGKHSVILKGHRIILPISKTYIAVFLARYHRLQEPVVFTQNDPGYLFL